MIRILLSALTIAGVILSWEYVSGSIGRLSFLLPSPSSIWQQLAERPERFLLHSLVTVKEMLGGMFLGCLAAFPLAWMMFRWKRIGSVLQHFFVLVQCIPMFVLAPLMVFWFGISYTAIVIPTFLMIFFPLTITFYRGLASTPPHYLDFFRHQQATPWQLFTKLQLPWSLPYFCAGLRISASIAGIGAVAGEWAGGQEGLGVLMVESRRAADLQTLFAALFCLAVSSLLIYGSILLIEKKCFTRFSTIGVLVLIISCSFMAGCQKEREKTSTRLLLDWLPNPNHVPIYAGIENRIFENHRINLEILKIRDPADGIPFLLTKQADISLFYTPETIRANYRGMHLNPIGVLISQPLNSLIFRKDSGIKNPNHLQNKVIGYSSDGSGALMIAHLLSMNGVSPKKIVNHSFDLVGSLGLGHVDAIFNCFWNIEGEHLRSLGIETDYFDVAQLGYPTYNELIFIAREGSPEAESQFVNAFQEALQESIRFCHAYPEEAFNAYARANPDKSTQTLKWEKNAWNLTLPLLAQSQKIDEEEWVTLTEWLLSKKYFQ